MKKFIVIMMLQMVSTCLMADETEAVRQTSLLLKQVEKQMPEQWDASGYVDNYIIWKGTPEFGQLEKVVSGNWKVILGEVKEIAPSDAHQVILLASCCSLPLEDSFLFLDKISDLCLGNVITKDVFLWIMDLYEVYTMPTHRLSLNYKKPAVAEILRKAKIIAPERTENYDNVLTGEAKKELEEEGLGIPAHSQDGGVAHRTTAGSDQPPSATNIPAPVSTKRANTPEDIGLAIVQAARNQVGRTMKYDPGYVPLEYPMGDIPIETGVCTDVIIRALRDALNMDLQQLVHEDMKAAFLLYPKNRGVQLPDKSIDHRRVLNQMKYFKRKGFSVPVTDNPEDYLPGDIVACGVHIMIVSDRKNEQGVPLIIHNIGRGAREEKGLLFHDITGHYRMTHKGSLSKLNNAVVIIGVIAIIGVMAAWRRLNKKQKRK